jgi:hypothetical protein
MARLDLAHALLQQGRLDEVVDEASQALDGFMRHDTILRANQLDTALHAAYPTAKETTDFHERLVMARRNLYSTESSSASTGRHPTDDSAN